MAASVKSGSVAQVDNLIDENGSRIDVSDDSSIRVARDIDPVVGGTSPANWRYLGLIALFIVALMLLLPQLLNGNRQTEMIPGTPVTAPQNGTPVPAN